MPKASMGGYVKASPMGGDRKLLTDGQGNVIARGFVHRCKPVKGWERGGWLSNERCSYHFVDQGQWYSCRGRGDGIAASCMKMKTPSERNRRGLAGATRKRRRSRK